MFTQNNNYPTWNPRDTTNIPAIPNWTNKYGENTISFQNGAKFCYVNSNKFKNGNFRCGDYTIQINIPKYNNHTQITDKEFISILKKEESDLSLLQSKAIDNFNKYLQENDLTNAINAEELNDIEKLFLNYAWHRCIIEERIYQQPYYRGSTTFLNIIK